MTALLSQRFRKQSFVGKTATENVCINRALIFYIHLWMVETNQYRCRGHSIWS